MAQSKRQGKVKVSAPSKEGVGPAPSKATAKGHPTRQLLFARRNDGFGCVRVGYSVGRNSKGFGSRS